MRLVKKLKLPKQEGRRERGCGGGLLLTNDGTIDAQVRSGSDIMLFWSEALLLPFTTIQMFCQSTKLAPIGSRISLDVNATEQVVLYIMLACIEWETWGRDPMRNDVRAEVTRPLAGAHGCIRVVLLPDNQHRLHHEDPAYVCVPGPLLM